MSVNLVKGQKINLVKESGDKLRNIIVGLGWDEAKRLFNLGHDIDCDASVILCGAGGKVMSNEPVVYYGHLTNSNRSILHKGDNLTGAGAGDDESILVDLDDIPNAVDKLVFVVNIYQAEARNQHFGRIQNAYIHIVDSDTREEICRYNLSDSYDGMTGVIVAEVYRNNGGWKFSAVGQGVKRANTISDLIELYK